MYKLFFVWYASLLNEKGTRHSLAPAGGEKTALHRVIHTSVHVYEAYFCKMFPSALLGTGLPGKPSLTKMQNACIEYNEMLKNVYLKYFLFGTRHSPACTCLTAVRVGKLAPA